MKRTLLKPLAYIFFGGLFITNTYAQSGKSNVIQDNRIPELLSLKSKMTNNDELVDRYKIQLYYGTVTGANSVHSKYKSRYDEWEPKIVYESPNYKVWVGNFRNRLEADRALLQVQKLFPNAFVMKPER
ncbi:MULTISPECIES: SPOR domain-containing protein [unclassified Leeuwenhoekiella]|uniref:SPOR domain-containing protein n=1 Tax=unclassified Leeuwenhoekiella TaxID=2615029 RepID=UPI00048AFBEC|nr:SPOR domain-containing protein [Leeuwenhoekiella sp. MAR_2009_132]